MSETLRVTKAAGTIGTATLLSRMFGYVRDMLFALLFGAGPVADAFIAAFRIPNLLRRLLGEGSLSIAFVTVFADYLTNRGTAEAFRLAGAAFKLLCLVLLPMAVLGVMLSPQIIKLIAFGFTDATDTFALAVTLCRIMFPYVAFVCLMAFSMGFLNVLGQFAAPAAAPVLLNLAMIGAMGVSVLMTADVRRRIIVLAVGVLIGGALQLSVQVPFWFSAGFRFRRQAPWYHPGLLRIGGSMVPATFGAAALQINTLVQTLLASFLPAGSLSYLYYADRLVQFPLAIFGIAVATAVLPSLSKQAAVKDFEALGQTFVYAMNLVLFVTMPAMVGLIVLREPIVALLFKRGVFDAGATQLTALALLYYSMGLWAFAAVRIVYNTFYAMQDTRTPVWTAMVSIGVNIALGTLLMKPMGHAGLALALTLASAVNLGLLVRVLEARLGGLRWRGMVMSACKTALSSAIMGLAVWIAGRVMLPPGGAALIERFLGLGGCLMIGVGVYGGCAYGLRSGELETLLETAGGRLSRRWR